MLAFHLTSFGEQTRGKWSLYFDGSQVPGLAAEDVTNASVDPSNGDLYLSLEDNGVVGGVSVNPKQVLQVRPLGGGAFNIALSWNGPANGLDYALDAFDLGW